ncbi:MAG: hypothetical protein WC721_21950 [Victivallaceae bacterium]
MPKSKYDESLPGRAGEYAADGMNNAEIAAKLDISEDTFYTYQRQFPEFAAAVETGRLAVSADSIESSLMDMALGRCFTTIVRRSPGGRETKTMRQLVPNLKMLIRWLERNRQYAGDSDIRTSEPVKVNIPVNSKYDENFLEDVERHAAEGYTDLQIARRLGIALSSFYNYKKQFPDFAAALDSGRRECYGRLRCQLLALALGKCTVRTETCRDGDFRKSTERQLPPDLKAIRYWLTGANREVRSQESGVRIGAGEAGGCPSGKTASAQGHSKISEWESPRVREWKVESEKSGKLGIGKCRADVQNVDMVYAQEHSNVSESGGCPSGNAGRMGKTASAQEHSNVSEWESPRVREWKVESEKSGKLGIGKCRAYVQNVDMVYAQEHSNVSESGGCPSGNAGRMGKTASAQEHSNVSECLESAAFSQTSRFPARSNDRRFAKMSRKERQRLLKNRREQ